ASERAALLVGHEIEVRALDERRVRLEEAEGPDLHRHAGDRDAQRRRTAKHARRGAANGVAARGLDAPRDAVRAREAGGQLAGGLALLARGDEREQHALA